MLAAPHLALRLLNPRWVLVFRIPYKTVLPKGRHGPYHDISTAAGNVHWRYLCYSWGDSSRIFYVGSVAADYVRGNFRSNLQARVHNYLQNHRTKETGHKNTNLMVFEKINEALQSGDVFLRIFEFDSLTTPRGLIAFQGYTEDPDLVRAVEQLCLWHYRQDGQCTWNRG